jgi:probable F420-dependent oxidoreductase
MNLGFGLPTSGPWATADNLTAVAGRAEQLGYASLWSFQHLLYPTSPQNGHPRAPNEPWSELFRRMLDHTVSLAYVAAATRSIRLGVAVLNLPYYSPALLAKQLSTLDVISNGRLDVGVGIGWSRDEYQAVGVPFRDRGARADEYLRCLKAIWTETEVSFSGRFYELPRSIIEPKPVQQPHPPLLVGGYVEASLRRAVEFGDGYIFGDLPPQEVQAVVSRLAKLATEYRRGPLRTVCRGLMFVTDRPGGADRRPFTGTYQEIREDVARYEATGLTDLFLDVNFDPRVHGRTADPQWALDHALRALDAIAPQRRPDAV